MGLDMFIYKAITPGINTNETHKYEDLKALGYSIFDDADVNEKFREDIKKVAVPCMIDAEFTDYEKMRKYLGVEERPEIYGIAQDMFFLCADEKTFKMREPEFRKFNYRKVEKFWVVKFERVGYWRNCYELQNYIYALKKKKRVDIENCGYFLLSNEDLKNIDTVTNDEYNLQDYSGGNLFYHEWY